MTLQATSLSDSVNEYVKGGLLLLPIAKARGIRSENSMNTMIFPEDVANVIQSFCACNKGDEATTDLLLTVGAELLDISPDKMLEMIAESF